MTSRILPIIRANAEFDIAGTLPLLVRGAASLDRTKIFCRNLRRKGICSLFVEGLPELLHADLQKSGAAYLYALQSSEDAAKVTSDAGPFYDAIASGDNITARDISRRSRPTWNSNEEYEEDFLYVWFLMN